MSSVTIRELRNNGREIIDRVQAGDSFVVTRSGRPVAELKRLPRWGPDPETLLNRWRHLSCVDPAALRRDIDQVIDSSL